MQFEWGKDELFMNCIRKLMFWRRKKRERHHIIYQDVEKFIGWKCETATKNAINNKWDDLFRWKNKSDILTNFRVECTLRIVMAAFFC